MQQTCIINLAASEVIDLKTCTFHASLSGKWDMGEKS